MDIALEYLGIVSHSPWVWGGGVVLGVVTLPMSMFFMDHLTQIISDLILRLNELLIRRLPKFIREPLQRRMVRMIEKSMVIMKNVILRIQS